MENSERALIRRERAFVLVFGGLIALGTSHFVHTWWQSFEWLQHLNRNQPPATGAALIHAPDAYRILMPALIGLLARLFPFMGTPSILAGIDAILLWVSLWLLYLLTTTRSAVSPGRGAERALQLALVYLFAVTPLPWLPQYARPETMPTTVFLLTSAICLRGRKSWSLPLQLFLTAVQAFIRADAPFCFGLAVLAIGFTNKSEESEDRTRLVLWGAAATLIAVLVQAYLQFIRFPHLSYDPNTPVIQLLYNFLPHRWINASLATFPIGLALLYSELHGQRILVDKVDRICLVAAGFYFLLWYTVGSLAEVRIYLPFLLLLAPLAARSVALCLNADGHAPSIANDR